MQPTGGDISREPHEGWHCQHLYYRFDRQVLSQLSAAQLAAGAEQFRAILDPAAKPGPARLQSLIMAGHKADFGLMVLDADPLVIGSVHQRLLASGLGPALVPTYSFVSVTEVSEYVPTAEQYGQRLIEEGTDPESPAFKAKVKAYADREVKMREQRLTPELPPWPNMCFYPMNKIRDPHANWFTLPSAERHKLMSEHGRTGMTFAGKVTQLITVSFGFDDWEWGVTLWAARPEHLKEIVYRMRFDEASAKYAEFGPFYMGYLASGGEILEHCRIGAT